MPWKASFTTSKLLRCALRNILSTQKCIPRIAGRSVIFPAHGGEIILWRWPGFHRATELTTTSVKDESSPSTAMWTLNPSDSRLYVDL
ncbi:uncharacterized protein CLUP02_02437 [Colletotrichum lupini]|uniref:Uncharacterized protein n=1 Tax=Colletotrichum lupini TaxID=145971 RepID=A0A9Q8WBC9_9PEZI|nr:uncharacterized protein CLUP02_02437 [Colletotrichum lupini]UQC76971.1 hypothetical protein CLUP02_02437 [Colletotrichum lupini]